MIAIAAMAQNRTIGRAGKLPWPSIPEDFLHFRRMTLGQRILVGRETFETLPPLKNREIVVLTNNRDLLSQEGEINYQSYTWGKMDAFKQDHRNSVVCGGAQIYSQLLPECATLYLTLVKKNYYGDTFMPPFEHLFWKKEILQTNTKFEISRYERIY